MRWLAVAALLVASIGAAAAYDKSWYEIDYWPGEYPEGFSIKADNFALAARKKPDPKLKASLSCPVPKGAVFHPWNEARDARYRSYSKIVPLKVTAEFVYEFTNEEGYSSARTIEAGETIEYLAYQAEGHFFVRYQGKVLTAGQDLFEHVAPVDEALFGDDQWVEISCDDGKRGWVLLSDLRNKDGSWIAGLDGPQITEFGKAADLKD
jgi:hypothetical protein